MTGDRYIPLLYLVRFLPSDRKIQLSWDYRPKLEWDENRWSKRIKKPGSAIIVAPEAGINDRMIIGSADLNFTLYFLLLSRYPPLIAFQDTPFIIQ